MVESTHRLDFLGGDKFLELELDDVDDAHVGGLVRLVAMLLLRRR